MVLLIQLVEIMGKYVFGPMVADSNGLLQAVQQ